jgi:hypothetical protein
MPTLKQIVNAQQLGHRGSTSPNRTGYRSDDLHQNPIAHKPAILHKVSGIQVRE